MMIKTILAIIVLILSIRFIESDGILLLIVQTLFSSSVILETIQLIAYCIRINELYNQVYQHFFTDRNSNKNAYWIQWYVVEYESIKSYYKVRLDSKLFNKYNDSLGNNWKEIEKNITC